MQPNATSAIDALLSLPPDMPRDQWVRAGMSAKAAGIDFGTFNDWSAKALNYQESDCRSTWRSFKTGKGIGAGTLFRMVAEHSGAADKPKRAFHGRTMRKADPDKPHARPTEAAPKLRVGMSPAEVYERCEPATNSHPYIVTKGAAGVPLGALRVVPAGDHLTIARQSVAGFLVVPAHAPDGTLQSLVFIPPNGGKKLNLPGASMTGASFTIGELAPGGVAYVVEGVGTAWSCWQATGSASVVCFGWGSVAKIAAQLRQRDASARLVMVPDVGKESDADRIAAEVGAAVVKMPDGWEQNSDMNDLAQRDGRDALQMLLETATEPPKPEPEVHPLARFVDFDGIAKPPRWVIPGFIGQGVVVISGGAGVGKTTVMLPMALVAAGLHGGDLMPRHWRHVVYVTEDVEQARRILAGITCYSSLEINQDAVRERVHLVEAVRLDPAFVVKVGKTYREQFTRTIEGVEVLPLVVIDTKSAVFELENENDNSETSRMMAALKQEFEGLPVWLIGHVAKANIGRNDVAALSDRGAGATGADGNQTLFLIRDGENRYLVLGKVRFEPRWPELEIFSHTASTTSLDEFGNPETVILRWGVAAPPQLSRKEAAEQAAELAHKADEASLRQCVRDAIEAAWLSGNPLNRAGVKAKVRRKASDVVATLENLLSERWLHEVTVPTGQRTNNNRAAFLVNLTTQEHDAVLFAGTIPSAKLVIPESWQKPPIPSVPEKPTSSGTDGI